MKAIIRTTEKGDMVDLIAQNDNESERLKIWCNDNHPNIDNFNIWCNPIKKGDWVVSYRNGIIFKFGSNELDGRVYNCKGCLMSVKYEHLRPMHEDEIEKYLFKEAQERGFCAGRRFRWICTNADHNVYNGAVVTMILNKGVEYLPEKDALVVGVMESEIKNAIYMDGEWAIPVYDIKPRRWLPKTKLELQCAFYDYQARNITMKQFLDEYEDR
jgi:hypothetical protein